MREHARVLAIAAASTAVLLLPARGEPPASTWSQFRGNNGSGIAVGCEPPVTLDFGNVAWITEVPPGHSSPVLTDSLVILTGVEDNRLVTLAFDKEDGSLSWRAAIEPDVLERVHEASSPAAATPCIDGDRVYVYFGSYGLICYDLEGGVCWTHPIPTPQTLYGMSSSPILYRNLLIQVLDDDANLPDSRVSRSKILALDKLTGELVWETLRPFQRSGWSTPTIWKHDGGEELVVLGNGRLYGYEASTGIEKWHVNGFSRETISRPIAGDGVVYASASMIGGVPDEQPDPEPYWTAVLQFDANLDGKLQREEMTGQFTFPFRPDLPVGHPGYGMPLPRDPARRRARLDAMFVRIDRDGNGDWTRDEFLLSIAFDRGKPNLVAVQPGGLGDVTESHVAWVLRRNIPEVPSPILHDGRIYLVRDGGIITAVDASNGEVLYRSRLGAAGHYRSSPVIANGHLYVISQEGIVSVVKTGAAFELAYQGSLPQMVSATPAIDESTLYVRTETQLAAFRGW